MDKKKILIIAGVAVVLYLLLFRNSSGSSRSKDETEAGNAFSNAANALTSGLSTVATAAAVQKSAEDEDYQNLLSEYKRLNGGTLPRGATSLTHSQLETAIKSLKDLQKAINEYYEIEDDAVQMTAEQLSLKGIDTVEEVNTLINEVKARQLDEHLTDLLNAFIKTCNNYGSIWNPAGASRQQWDVSTLRAIMGLSNSDLKKLSDKFKKRTNECKYPDNYSALNYRYYERTSLSAAIPTGTLCNYRSGSDVAREFRQNMIDRGY